MDTNNEYFKEFQDDINKVWTNKLVSEFNLQNGKIWRKLNKELALPNFVFTNDNKTWGTWDLTNRTITLSYKLLRDFEWSALVHTLKHEMAHMITSEIWSDVSDNGNSHGELFNKACEILEVDNKERHSSEDLASYRIPEKDQIVSKIYKLFCLGESNHKAEAELAIAKAHELMIKHNITLRDLPKESRVFVARPVGEIYKNVPAYVKSLSRIISEYYFVKYIFYSFWVGRRKGKYVEFYGEPQNLDVAEYVYHFLLNEGERQWKEFQQTEDYQNRFKDNNNSLTRWGDYGRRKGSYSKIAFLTGLYNGFARTLEKRDTEVKIQINSNNTMPICLDDPLLEEKYQKHYNPKSWHSSSGGCGGGYSEGASRGESIRVRQGVSTGSGGRVLIGA